MPSLYQKMGPGFPGPAMILPAMSCHERLDPFLQIWGLLNLSFVDAEASPLPVQTDGPARLECWLKTNITITGIAGSYQGSLKLCILYHKIKKVFFCLPRASKPLSEVRHVFLINEVVENRDEKHASDDIPQGDGKKVVKISPEGYF